MNIEVPFYYIILLSFLTLLKCENRRTIKISDLKRYCEILLEEVIDDYHKSNFYLEEDNWTKEPIFYIKDEDTLDGFLEEFSHLVHRDGDTLWLNDGVEFLDLYNEELRIRTEEHLSNRFIYATNNKKIFEFLAKVL